MRFRGVISVGCQSAQSGVESQRSALIAPPLRLPERERPTTICMKDVNDLTIDRLRKPPQIRLCLFNSQLNRLDCHSVRTGSHGLSEPMSSRSTQTPSLDHLPCRSDLKNPLATTNHIGFFLAQKPIAIVKT